MKLRLVWLVGLAVVACYWLLAAGGNPVQAAPTTAYESFAYNAGTELATWNLRITNDATVLTSTAITFGTPGAQATAVSGTGTCSTPLPASSPITCSVTASGTLVISFSTLIRQVCNQQNIMLGPDSVGAQQIARSDTSLVGGVAQPNAIPGDPTLCFTWSGITYSTATDTFSMTLTLAGLGVPAAARIQIFDGINNTNCPHLIHGPGLSSACVTGSTAFTNLVTTVTASSPAGMCGTLPAAATTATPVICNLPVGAGTPSVTIAMVAPQACSQNMAGTPVWAFQSPTGGAPTFVPSVYIATPGDIGLCPAVTVPSNPSVPAPAPPAPQAPVIIVGQVVPTPVIPVFQNPALGGLFNPIAKTPTPRPLAVAPQTAADPGGCVVPIGQGVAGVCLRPPNTGDAGLLSYRHTESD